jgi:HSP20 family protein
MAIVRYRTRPTLNPWAEMEPLTNRLARLMDPGFHFADEARDRTPWIPSVDVEETEDAVVLTADLPGFDVGDVDIQVENQLLTLSGTRERVREEPSAHAEVGTEGDDRNHQGRRVHLRERRWGSFSRSFTLPRTIRTEEISASFDRGVLTVHMPKAEEARSRKIEIRTGA